MFVGHSFLSPITDVKLCGMVVCCRPSDSHRLKRFDIATQPGIKQKSSRNHTQIESIPYLKILKLLI